MDNEMILRLGHEALITVLLVAGPLLALAMVTGLLVSVFQATTQLNEQTLAFVPKIFAVLAGALLLGPWMMTNLVSFTARLLNDLPSMIQ
ncbi:MAG: flagellar biosynthesis protein FliQ [Thermaerobacterales bacterium]